MNLQNGLNIYSESASIDIGITATAAAEKIQASHLWDLLLWVRNFR